MYVKYSILSVISIWRHKCLLRKWIRVFVLHLFCESDKEIFCYRNIKYFCTFRPQFYIYWVYGSADPKFPNFEMKRKFPFVVFIPSYFPPTQYFSESILTLRPLKVVNLPLFLKRIGRTILVFDLN